MRQVLNFSRQAYLPIPRQAMIMTNWTASDIPSQHGRTAVVTGTGGLGFQDALALARAGANVIIAGRSQSKGAAAVNRIRQSIPSANVSFEALDLASLDSIAAFAERLRHSQGSLDGSQSSTSAFFAYSFLPPLSLADRGFNSA